MHNNEPSIEGVFTGFWANHYVITGAKLIEAADRTHSLDGGPHVMVHRDKVLLVQELYS